MSKSNQDFLFDLFRHITPAHLAIFLRLIRLYPMCIVNDLTKRERTILAIVNEVTNSNYDPNVWPSIMSISRIPELVNQVLLHNEDQCLWSAIKKLQFNFELQSHRFTIHQLIPSCELCLVCGNPLKEMKFDEMNNIIMQNNVFSCAMYKMECCELVYKYGHVRNPRTRERFVIPGMIFNQKFIHIFDHVLYERQMLVTFTNLILEAATSFQSYANVINLNIDQNNNLNNQLPERITLNAKCLSIVRKNHCFTHQSILIFFLSYLGLELV